MFGLARSVPERPPSPPTDSNQLFGEPLQAQVPLSWVPPITSWRGLLGLIDTCWYCSVARPAFKVKIRVGMAFSHIWQSTRFAPAFFRLGSVQVPEVSANRPLVRTTPPSEPTNAMSGFEEANTMACWSGCMPSGGDWVSFVMSVKLSPPSTERWMVRPFDGLGAPMAPWPISSYCIWPPIQTASGLPGGDATGMSYEHWPPHQLKEA